jgi:hypothetical protein
MRTTLVVSLFASLLLAEQALAQPPGGGGGGPKRPKLDFDEEQTPLQSAVEAAVQKRQARNPDSSPDCQAALKTEPPDPKKVAKACKKLMGHKKKKLGASECPDCGDRRNPQGKLVGKKVATETTIVYEHPGQKGLAKWAGVKMKKRAVGGVGHGAGNGSRPDAPGGGSGARLRNGSMFPGADSNDDRDCLDTATGAHKGGVLVSDGAEGSCFDAAGLLKAGHEELVDEDGPEQIDDDNDGALDEDPQNGLNDDDDCLSGPDAGDPNDPADDSPGEHLRGADCRAGGQLKVGFIELIDEDGSEPVDQDADGSFDEDPPASFAAGCQGFGGGGFVVNYRSRKDGSRKSINVPAKAGLVDSSGDECDVTRAMMVAVNEAVLKDERNKDAKRKVFKVDDNGMPDTGDAASGFEYGTEPREVTLSEEYAIRCEDPAAELVDGECVTPPPAAAALTALALAGPLEPNAALLAAAAATGSVTDRAMMGFTFAPPVIEWGFKIQEEVCIDLLFDEICFEVFFARVGYEFDVAAGLRLPVEVTVSGVPTPMALAETKVDLTASLKPLDFTVGDYKAFCQKHHLDQEQFIASCERFAFVDFIDSLNPFTSGDEKDGAEFVAQATAFAGVQVRVLSIPIISWGLDVAFDLPTLCTMFQIMDEKINLLEFGINFAQTQSLVDSLKKQLGNCASFETPYGFEDDPFNPGVKRLRAFPFLSKSFDVRADCAQALVEGEVITIKGKKRPICTNILLGINGASLGVGFGVELQAGSNLITSDWSVHGDGQAAGGQANFRHDSGSDQPDQPVLANITLDNFDGAPGADLAKVRLDDFTYHLNTIQIRLKANLEFGGILDFIPDLDSFTIWSFHLSADPPFTIPIGQHAGTEPLEIPIFVQNHALEVVANPGVADPDRIDEKTLAIKPGTFGTFEVNARNLGNVTDDFDTFRRALSNRPGQDLPFEFVINPNTDQDCRDAANAHFRGNPYDFVADECFTVGGALRSDRTAAVDEDDFGPAGGTAAARDQDSDGLADEDPPDVWTTSPEAAELGQRFLKDALPGELASNGMSIAVRPFRHPLTAPGDYPFQVTADSKTARIHGLAAVDPSGLVRRGATDVVFIRVTSFFDPNLALIPPSTSGKPGVIRIYVVEGENGGNSADSIDLATLFLDSNQTACTLTTLGGSVGCPHRASVTQIPIAWTTIAGLGPRYGPLDPLGRVQDSFSVLPPATWAGMVDTTYDFTITGTSTQDGETPRASEARNGTLTVIATKESMTRYIGLEIDELIQQIDAVNAAGTKTAGLRQMMRQVLKTSDQALASVVAGDLAGASTAHGHNIKLMEAFVHELDGSSGGLTRYPEAVDFQARADAILRDLALAQASGVPSAAP